MNKVVILKTPNADTRSMQKLDYKLVKEDTINHIIAVQDVINELSNVLRLQGIKHDYTKLDSFDEFFEDMSATIKTDAKFKSLSWWKKHLEERHHLNDRCPDDVNLLDVIEMIADMVCAGKARSGNVYPVELNNEILQKAVSNTVKMLIEMVVVDDE